MCQIDVSPDKEHFVTLQQCFNSDKAGFQKTDFDFRFARLRKMHNHPTGRDATGAGGGWNQSITNAFAWRLIASAADEAEQDQPDAARPDAAARPIDTSGIDIQGNSLDLPPGRAVEVTLLVTDSRGPILFFGRAHTALRPPVQLDPVQPREAREFSAEIVDGVVKVWGNPSSARAWVRVVG